MMSRVLSLLALAASAAATISPLCLFASTAELPAKAAIFQNNPTAPEVYRSIYQSLGSCPTRHYVVIEEPRTLSYTSAWVPEARNAKSQYVAKNMDGQLNINFILNVILMDCLHHGVLTVKELDTADLQALPDLDAETVAKSIIYARMPAFGADTTETEYNAAMALRQRYVQNIMEKYFNSSTDYTLVYARQEELQVEGHAVGHEIEDEKEIPLVEGQ